jgi:integrase
MINSLALRRESSKICDLTLPSIVSTRGGAEFDPRLDIWNCHESSNTVKLDFGKLPITPEMKLAAKKVFVWYAQNKSLGYLDNLYFYLKKFLSFTVSESGMIVSSISPHQIINYYATLKKRDHYYLGSISGLMKKWHEMRYLGIEDGAIAILKQLRLTGNKKGEAVLTMDPVNGPYTDLENQAILFSLETAFKDEVINLGEYVLVSLFLALGLRPVQYALLKVCDVKSGETKNGMTVYSIRVPRAKLRHSLPRSEFKNRLLIAKLGENLLRHASEVQESFMLRLEDPGQAPLFPTKGIREKVPNGFEYHQTSRSLSRALSEIVGRLEVRSERTGKPLNVNAYRFRRSVGTRAAVEGHGELIIAELLDHTDTQNVSVYVQAMPEIIERIDRAVALQLAPLAAAFAGVIIKDETEAAYAGDPACRVCDPRFDPLMKPMGNCDNNGFCGLSAPIACYQCRGFRPWLDGPHGAVLDYLINERERLLVSSDLRVASICDRTILAVAEVVRQCQLIRDIRGFNG